MGTMYAGSERRNRVIALVLAIVLVAGVVLALLATIVQAVPAKAIGLPAHARLLTSAPANESTVDSVPQEIRLTFDEPVLPALTQVRLMRDSTTVETSAPKVDGAVVTVKTIGTSEKGGYRVVWQVAGSDGHPLAGETTFGVGQAAPIPRVLPTYKTPQSQPTTFGHPDHLPGLIAAGVLLLGGVGLLVYEQRRRRRLMSDHDDQHEQQPIS